ncbi:MAG: histidine kinase [Spirochaetaceae bacterium]|nr:MAG: histidine kinase [Spirochaetaceae bacterium]
MKIKTKIICVTGIVLVCVIVVSTVSIWTLNEISRLKETIDNGVELIGRARTIHSLMKDLMFDIFTPQTYRLLKDIIFAPRFQTTRRSFRTAVVEFQGEFHEFMESPRVKRLLRDEELQDAYAVAQVISGKAFIKIEDFQSKLDQLAGSGVLGEESLYEQVQIGTETTIPLFFDEVRDTSYYLTNSFESFLSHFIRSLEDQSAIIRRRILIFFWSITAVIGVLAVFLSLLLARQISQRIGRVEQGFRLVSMGDFTATLNIRTNDEFGVLAKSFNLFMKDLKRNVDSVLNLMRDISGSITERLRFDKILELIVESAVKDSNADGSAFLTLNENGGITVGQTTGVVPYPKGRTITEEEADALSGKASGKTEAASSLKQVFLKRKPLYIRKIKSCAAVSPDDRNQQLSSLLALPLVVSQQLLGVFCVFTYGEVNHITDLDYTNFSTFIDYASVILDNFFKYKELLERREAEYAALQSQIQPHFLYNLLNGLIGLNRMGNRKSLEGALFSLKDMLRYTLEQSDWSTVAEEFRFVGKYCELQQVRFQERLSVEIHCEEHAASFPIPKLILQPLVENAVIHGIEPLGESGRLKVSARAIRKNGGSGVGILVIDNGVGFSVADHPEDGHIGLRNVRDRLSMAFPHASLKIDSEPGRGTRIAMEIVGDRSS